MTPITATRPRYRVGNLPVELTVLERWVCFALAPGKSGKPEKVPYTPGTRQKARSNDPTTWRSFEAALATAEQDGLFLGFAFTPDLEMTFIDLDGVLGANGALKQYAALVVDTLESYTEVSIGGSGVHVIVKGRPPTNFTKELIKGKAEVYPTAGGRFCLMTGEMRPGLGSGECGIEERTIALGGLFPPKPPVDAPKPSQNGTHAELTIDELEAIVAAIAPHRVEGQQHFIDLATAGILFKNGVPEGQADDIICLLSDTEAKARKAVRDTYDKGRAGGVVQGYRGLEELIADEGTLKAVDDALRRLYEARQAKLITPGRTARLLQAQGPERASEADRWPAPPPEVYHGWFGGYLELVANTTEAPDQFHLASALTIIGAYAGRNVHVRHASTRIFANLYTVLVGLSSESKKDTAAARACEMVMDPPWARERTAPPYVEKFGVASAESFVKGLSTNSNVLIRMSEFSEVLANARRKGTSTILTMLMKAWDAPPQLSNDSIANPAIAFNPYVAILAGTQPDVLAADLIGTDITSGFANRVLFVPGSGKARMPRPPEVEDRKLHEHWLKARRNLQQYGIGERIEIAWTSRTVELWDAFYLAPRGDSTMERTMSQRHQIIVLKVALIFAMTDCSKVITYQHLERAIAFIDWHWEQVRRLITGWATSNDNRLEERILAVLRATGPIKRRVLQKKTKDPKWTSNDFARLIRSMLDNGTLGVSDDLIGIKDD